jgi:F420-dependent oxidoreductase-like protein
MRFDVPVPCLVVLIGPSGSGKTTWARQHFEEGEIVSSDALRAMVGAGEDDQVAGTAAFDVLERIVSERMKRGITTVVDTLGFDRDRRTGWVSLAHENGVPAHAVVFEADRDVAEERNAQRRRPIPKTILGRQHTRFKKVMGEIEDEGFDAMHRVISEPGMVLTVGGLELEDDLVTPPAGHTFGLIVSRFNWGEGDLADNLTSIARRAEAAGFRDMWVMDHFRQIPQVGRAWEDIPEAYTALSFIAGLTTKIRLGALVTGITHRHPVVLGKMLASLDVLSGGRAIAGLGAAWDEKEHDGYGITFPSVRDRYELLEETLQMLPLLWGKGSPSFDGKFIQASELICYPRPIQDPIPIMIGGSGEKKTLRLVAKYADMCNLFGDPDRIRQKVDILHRHCSDVDRDPSQVEVTHLTRVLAASDRKSLRARVEELRDRNVPADTYVAQNNAGTPPEIAGRIARFSESGATHTIVSMPDVSMEGSVEAFGQVIASLAST